MFEFLHAMWQMKAKAFDQMICKQNNRFLLHKWVLCKSWKIAQIIAIFENWIWLQRFACIQNEKHNSWVHFIFTNWKNTFWGASHICKMKRYVFEGFFILQKNKKYLFVAFIIFTNSKIRFWSAFLICKINKHMFEAIFMWKNEQERICFTKRKCTFSNNVDFEKDKMKKYAFEVLFKLTKSKICFWMFFLSQNGKTGFRSDFGLTNWKHACEALLILPKF